MQKDKCKPPFRVIVIGIDGATFDIIDPLIEKGELPNFAALIARGTRGTLSSVVPDLSPAAWSSFMTGKHPGKHGILDFFGQRPGSYDIVFYNASYRKSKPIWTLLSEVGKTTCVINVPYSYPPDAVNGIMISGMDTPGEYSHFVYPKSFRAELDAAIGGYIIEKAERNVGHGVGRYMENLMAVSNNRFAAAEYLLKKQAWDFFMVVFESTDRAQHNFWKYMDPHHPEYRKKDHARFGSFIADIYKDIDRKLGGLMRYVPENAVVIIVSDHGFGPLRKGVRLTNWLKSEGYLTVKNDYSFGFTRLFLKEKLRRVVKKKPFSYLLKFRKVLEVQSKGGMATLDFLNMNKTQVYPIGGCGSLCINLKSRQPSGVVSSGAPYERLRDELIEKLSQLRDPETNQLVIRSIRRREDVYDVFPDETPDLLIEWEKGYSAIGERELAVLGIRRGNMLFTPHRWSGNHLPNGIFIAGGPPIRQNAVVENAEIVDMAPTILSVMDMDVPNDMDGSVIEKIFTNDFLADANIRRSVADPAGNLAAKSDYSNEESEIIKDRLRALGYIE